MSFALLPKEINLEILKLLDLKSKMMLRATGKTWHALFSSQPKNLDDVKFMQELYVQKYSTFRSADASELAAKVFNKSVDELRQSEIFETNVLQHALMLDREMCPSIPADVSVGKKAEYYTDVKESQFERILFRYKELTEQQVKEIAAVYNKYYPAVKATVYNPNPYDSNGVDFVLVMMLEPFCKKAIPVMAGVLDKPAKRSTTENDAMVNQESELFHAKRRRLS